MDTFGHHGLSCKFNDGRLSRHAKLNETIKRSFSSCGIPSKLEPVGVSRTDGKHPDGLTYIPLKGGKCFLWDCTCIDPFAKSYQLRSKEIQGYAAKTAEDKKNKLYKDLTDRFHFSALAFETLGSFGQEAKLIVNQIGDKLIEATGEKRAKEFLKQTLSLTIQAGNAASIMGCFPHTKNLNNFLFILN
jgi:hypothetical protein